MGNTKSESLFIEWCALSKWKCEKIPEGNVKTPDFEWFPGGQKVYVEVKEIDANEEELGVLEKLKRGERGGPCGEEPGKTVREKIKASYQQQKSHTKLESCPGVLVLYNNTGMAGLGRVDQYHVLVGMFGLQTIPYALSPDGSWNQYAPDYFGQKSQLAKREIGV
jgi:hypothetical protein